MKKEYSGDDADITVFYVADAANFGKIVTRLLSDDTFILFYTSVVCIGRTRRIRCRRNGKRERDTKITSSDLGPKCLQLH